MICVDLSSLSCFIGKSLINLSLGASFEAGKDVIFGFADSIFWRDKKFLCHFERNSNFWENLNSLIWQHISTPSVLVGNAWFHIFSNQSW